MTTDALAWLSEVNWLRLQGFNQTADAMYRAYLLKFAPQPHAGHDLERDGKRDDV